MSKRIEDQLNQIAGDISEIKIVQAEQHMTLQDHTRRSKASEARIGIVEGLAEKTWYRLDGHFKWLKGVMWTLAVLAGGLGVLWTGVQIYLAIRGIKP